MANYSKTASGIRVNMASAGIQARQGLSAKTFNEMVEQMYQVASTPNYAQILRGRIVGGVSTSFGPDIRITDYMGKGGRCLLVECCHYKRWAEGAKDGVCQECIDYCRSNPKSRVQKVVEYKEVLDRILGNNGAKIAGPEVPEENMKYKFPF